MKIAIVHDYLTQYGGAERVFKAIHELFPEASVFTFIYDKKAVEKFIPLKDVHTTFLSRLPRFLRNRRRYFLPFFPVCAERFNLRDFDVVISSSSAFANGIVVKPKTLHISYCHSPMRFVWDWHSEYKKEQRKGFFTNIAIDFMSNYLRIWDFLSAQRVDYFIANSQNVADRIKKYYRRESKVIHPFFEHSHCLKNNCGGDIREPLPESYFLIISQLAPYKKIDLAVEAFNKLELPLIIIGDGKEKKRLKKMANPNIKLLGFVPEEEKWQILAKCQALIFPGEDDFGITMAEAISVGKPVLAFSRGSAREIIQEGISGEFFDDFSVECLAEAVKRIREKLGAYDAEKIKKTAEKFSKKRFKEEFMDFFMRATSKHKP
ncbi:MAG: glycosyltransferase [bacterium]